MGRQAKSDDVKEVKDTPPSRRNKPKPVSGQPLGDPPSWFGDIEAQVWRHVVAELDAMGLNNRADGHALALYCQAYATWWEASQLVDREGLMIDGFAGTKKAHPLLSIVRQTRTQMIDILKQFGLTPHARGAILAEPPKQADELVDFVKGRGKDQSSR